MKKKDYVTFENQAAQGELLFTRIEKLPDTAKAVEATDGRYVVGHSETGHHHVVQAKRGVQYFEDSANSNVAYIKLDRTPFADVIHLRDFDTHKSLRMPGNGSIFKINKQQEWSPEGWQKVMD